ncbi:MAG: hypothetical protein K8I02_11620, partial [Candidatus Methylomirabilis sp.]|nr:hypothetical protein [Deltaproteobacteria bacterium]
MPPPEEITSRGLWRLLDRAIFSLRGRGKLVLGALAALYGLAWLAGGVYAVDTQTTGVLRRFGRLADEAVPPG